MLLADLCYLQCWLLRLCCFSLSVPGCLCCWCWCLCMLIVTEVKQCWVSCVIRTVPLCELLLTEWEILCRFPCGRWLGKGVDDGAIERLLVAEQVPSTVDANGQCFILCQLSVKCLSTTESRIQMTLTLFQPASKWMHWATAAIMRYVATKVAEVVNFLNVWTCSLNVILSLQSVVV